MEINRNILYDKRQLLDNTLPFRKGEYISKYYKTDDKVITGRDGQNLIFFFNDEYNCSIIDLFSLPKGINERYGDGIFFQKTYGRLIQSSKNIEQIFNIKYDKKSKNNININDSLLLGINNKTILYNEDSEIVVNNSVLGNELVRVLEEIIDSIKIINKDLELHVHPNTAKPVIWRTGQIEKKLNSIKEYLPKILSNNFYHN